MTGARRMTTDLIERRDAGVAIVPGMLIPAGGRAKTEGVIGPENDRRTYSDGS